MMYVVEVGLDYFSDFFSFDNITVVSIHRAYHNKAQKQKPYAIMVTHHRYYDNPHFMEVPGFIINSQ